MPYSVKEQPKTGTGITEFIVVSSNGVMAPPPFGGPFLSKAAAAESCAALLKMLSIEEWIAAQIEARITDQISGSGKVLHIAPDGRWIQNRGRNTFAVYPPADRELELGEMVSIDECGEINSLDRSHSLPRMGR